MMSMKEDNNGGNTNINNWLGFSLSSQMKMEANTATDHHHHHYHHFSQLQTEAPPSSAASFYVSPTAVPCNYGGVPENGDFHSSFPIIPLKSDGSLCIMEALSRTQSQGSNNSPKLEDFLGGGGAFYPILSNNPMYQTTEEDQSNNCSKQTQLMGFNTQIIPQIPEGGGLIPCLKTWIDNHHDRQLEQQVNNMNTTNMVENRGAHAMGCNELQSLTLSMSPVSQSSCITATKQISTTHETKKRGSEKMGQKQTVHRKSIDTFGQRTSQYRGVTRHRWTGRYEAHLWDNSCKKEGQTRKGRQVYLGGYDMEEKAARSYDLAALKYWGPSTHINFPIENYLKEIEEMKNMTRQEFVAHLRRKSSGFSRGASIYRGVTRHHQHGRWQARIGRVAGNKDLYLGTFSTQEEAAEAYDVAAIKFRGVNAVTNFDISRYDVEKIMASNTLPSGDVARRDNKELRGDHHFHDIHRAETIESAPQTNGNVTSETINAANYVPNPNCVSAAAVAIMHDLISIDSSQNPSSLVTSLSSSREGSPNSSWINPAPPMRPVYAYWNDA